MKLSELKNGESGVIVKVLGHGSFRKRLTEMGFVKGKTVTVIKNAPLKDPIEYQIMGYNVSLRRKEASLIEVVGIAEEITSENISGPDGFFTEKVPKNKAREKGNVIHVALIGNPNSGKTTLFNYLSGLHEHVGNYPGVTVDSKTATVTFKGYTLLITDLPGTYSLSEYSPEERYVRKYLGEKHPDIVVNVVDASNLERNLYLTSQMIDMELPLVVALNMIDELQASGDRFDHKAMGELLDIPFVPTVAKKGKGIPHLLDAIVKRYANNEDEFRRHIRINYGFDTEKYIQSLQEKICALNATSLPVRYIAIRFIENDKHVIAEIDRPELAALAAEYREKLEAIYREDIETIFTDARYGFISGALKETYRVAPNNKRHRQTNLIDAFVTHKVWGFPIFLFVMWFIFYFTFVLGQYPMGWIELGIGKLKVLILDNMAEGAFKNLLINGIIGGVGSVAAFIPNILILFLFISLLEDTGYMARTAFIMDKLMHRIGLHGKSFIPLVMGFGCNVPAIMASRVVENPANRLLTILITPLMSCSARLPVYVLIIGAFFPKNAGNLLFLTYILGISLAVVMALIFKKTLFKGKEQPFVMELPPYRMPTLRSTVSHMWYKGSQYIRKMGGIILVAAIFVWALGYYPRDMKQMPQNVPAPTGQAISPLAENVSATGTHRFEQDSASSASTEPKQLKNSYLYRIGQTIEPALAPLGFDWKISVSLLSGIAAKEIIVSTMGIIHQVDDGNTGKLETRLRNDVYTYGPKKGEPVFNRAVALSFLTFVLIYFPCVAVVVAIRHETGQWRWALLSVLYTTGLAWIMSFVVYRIALMFI